MRVALFFDGKNFYSAWRDQTGSRNIDFVQLADWIVKRVGGSFFWGAYYYTGVEAEPEGPGEGQTNLKRFLDRLEMRPGFFVNRFPRKRRVAECTKCGAENTFSQEKEVDTTMVADMLRLAAVGAFDILVLMSGDADHTPAIEGVRALGRQAYVATWGGSGLSSRIRRAAFDHIDLMEGLDACAYDTGYASVASDSDAPVSPRSTSDDRTDPTDAIFLSELERAEAKFAGRYVGANFFVTSWLSDVLEPSPEVRRRVLGRLVDAGEVEIYTAAHGDKALRRAKK